MSARLLLHLAINLIAIRDAIDQLRRYRLLPQIRTRIDNGLKFFRRNLPRLANPIFHLVEPGIHNCGHLFFVRRGVLGLGIKVERGLVLVAMIAVKAHSQLAQRVFHERRFHDDSRQSHISRRLKINLVKRGREIIRAIAGTELAECLRVSDRELLVRAESEDGVANLLSLRHAHRSRADPRNHAHDPIVIRSAVDRIDHIAQCLPLGRHQPRRGRIRHIFQERFLQVGLKNRLRRNSSLDANHRDQHDHHSRER